MLMHHILNQSVQTWLKHIHKSLRSEHLITMQYSLKGNNLSYLLFMTTWKSSHGRHQPREQRLLIVQLLTLSAGDSGWQLFMIPHHHQLAEPILERNQSFRLHTLTSFIHDTY